MQQQLLFPPQQEKPPQPHQQQHQNQTQQHQPKQSSQKQHEPTLFIATNQNGTELKLAETKYEAHVSRFKQFKMQDALKYVRYATMSVTYYSMLALMTTNAIIAQKRFAIESLKCKCCMKTNGHNEVNDKRQGESLNEPEKKSPVVLTDINLVNFKEV